MQFLGVRNASSSSSIINSCNSYCSTPIYIYTYIYSYTYRVREGEREREREREREKEKERERERDRFHEVVYEGERERGKASFKVVPCGIGICTYGLPGWRTVLVQCLRIEHT